MMPLPRHLILEAARVASTDVDCDAVPLQAGMCKCPWRVALASIVSRPKLLLELFNRWPSPILLGRAVPWNVGIVVKSHQRARTLVKLSRRWTEDDWTDVRDLVGVYVTDAIGFFCFGDTDIVSKDRVLRRYADEHRSRGTVTSAAGLCVPLEPGMASEV